MDCWKAVVRMCNSTLLWNIQPRHLKWFYVSVSCVLALTMFMFVPKLQHLVNYRYHQGMFLAVATSKVPEVKSGIYTENIAVAQEHPRDNAYPTTKQREKSRVQFIPPKSIVDRSALNVCGRPNQRRACDVHIYSVPGQRKQSRRSGYITINNKTVHKWDASPRCLTVSIDLNCNAFQIIEYANKTDSKRKTIADYLETLPNRTIVAGICYGKGEEENGLVTFGVKKRGLDSLHYRNGVLTFLGWTGFPGHTRSQINPRGKVPNQLTSTFYIGLKFNFTTNSRAYDTALDYHKNLQKGGHWEPADCRPKWRMAVIVPFRMRERHLNIFLDNMIRFLKIQKVAFSIFIVEQAAPELFNRAALMNIGYLEARKLGHYDCYVFHDVDLIPEDLTNLYDCSKQPRHLVVTRSVTNYELRMPKYFGGGILLSPDIIQQINGFPNHLFGWGGEDDHIYARIAQTGVEILRYPLEIARYHSLPHGVDRGNPHMQRSVKEIYERGAAEIAYDGLNTTNYQILAIELRTIYTHIFVRIPGPVSQKDAEFLANTTASYDIPDIV